MGEQEGPEAILGRLACRAVAVVAEEQAAMHLAPLTAATEPPADMEVRVAQEATEVQVAVEVQAEAAAAEWKLSFGET